VLDEEEDEQDEMEAAVRASLASFQREQSGANTATEIIELEDEEETSAEDASRAKELLRRVAELQERNETLRQKLMAVNEKNDTQDKPDDELERAIKLSLQQPESDKDTKPASRSTLFSEDLLQGQDIDRIGDGSTFFLNRIRGLPPTGNENTLTFKQIIQAVRKSFVNNENILTFNQKF